MVLTDPTRRQAVIKWGSDMPHPDFTIQTRNSNYSTFCMGTATTVQYLLCTHVVRMMTIPGNQQSLSPRLLASEVHGSPLRSLPPPRDRT